MCFTSFEPNPTHKFNPQQIDPANGDDMAFYAFGANAVKEFKDFKKSFTCCNPREAPPSKKEAPNCKIKSLLAWIKKASQLAWMLGKIHCRFLRIIDSSISIGKNGSIDEQTTGFQGKHTSKARVTCKKEGDGFLEDFWCNYG